MNEISYYYSSSPNQVTAKNNEINDGLKMKFGFD